MKKLTARQRVITNIQGRKRASFTRKQLKTSLGIPEGTVSAVLSYMKQAGLVLRTDANRYARTKLFGTLSLDQMLERMRDMQDPKRREKRDGGMLHRQQAARVQTTTEAATDLIALIEDGRRYRKIKPAIQTLLDTIK